MVLEQRPTDMESTLEKHTELLKEHSEQLTLIYTDVGHMKADIGMIKQALERQEKRFDAIAEVQRLILERLPEKE